MRLYIAEFKSGTRTTFGRWLLASPDQFDQVIADIQRSYRLLIEPLSSLQRSWLDEPSTIVVTTNDTDFYITVSPIDLEGEIVAI